MIATVPTIVGDLTAWLALLATLTVVLGAVAGLWRWTKKEFTGSVAEIVSEHLEPILTRLSSVEKQLIPNDGRSLRDGVDRIEKGVAAAAQTAVEVQKKLEE